MNKDNRNTIVFTVCAVLLWLLYQMFVLDPIAKRRQAELRAHQAAVAAQPIQMAAPGSSIFVSREQAVAQSPRVQIDTPALQGSLALKGGRIDDLYLKEYRETLAKNSPPVELFRPEGAKNAYFSDSGWTGPIQSPGPATVWTQTSTGALSPTHPVTLTWDNGQGLIFTRTISVDDRYMFTVVNTVANKGAAAVKLAPYASIQRQGTPNLTPNWLVNEGAVGSIGGILKTIPFKKWLKEGDQSGDTTGGYMGITDKYWLAAVSPDPHETVKGRVQGLHRQRRRRVRGRLRGPAPHPRPRRADHRNHSRLRRRQEGVNLAGLREVARHPPFRRRGGLGLAVVPHPADVLRA